MNAITNALPVLDALIVGIHEYVRAALHLVKDAGRALEVVAAGASASDDIAEFKELLVGVVTLLFGSKEPRLNNAYALKEYIDERILS